MVLCPFREAIYTFFDDIASLDTVNNFIDRAAMKKTAVIGFYLEWGQDQVPALMQLAFTLENGFDSDPTSSGKSVPLDRGTRRTTILVIHLPKRVVRVVFRPGLWNTFGFCGVPREQQVGLRNCWVLAKGGSGTDASQKAKGLITNYQLSTLWATVLGKRLPKTTHVRLSDCSSASLSDDQKRYAALDALAFLLIYVQLKDSAGTEIPSLREKLNEYHTDSSDGQSRDI